MASERQIEANRRNAALSTGPKSEEGKARSRGNAARHGMAGESAEVAEGRDSAAFRDRRESWAAEYRPSGAAGDWALDRAVAASLRIERCERAIEDLVASGSRRAKLSWDQDQEVEAATLAKGLARAPELVARQLAMTYHGAGILIETWERLEACLEAEGSEWTEAERSIALDLLGVAADLRRGPTPVDDPEGKDLRDFRLALAAREIDRLDDRRAGSLGDLDDLARDQAIDGDMAMLGKEAKLVLRYERDAWRRYRESIRDLRAPVASPAPAPAMAPPPPRVAPPPRPAPVPAPSPARSAPLRLDPSHAWDAHFAQLCVDSGLGDPDEIDLATIMGPEGLANLRESHLAFPPTERTQFEAVDA